MIPRILCTAALLAIFAGTSLAQDVQSRVALLENMLKKQQKTLEEQQELIKSLMKESHADQQAAPKTKTTLPRENAASEGEAQTALPETGTSMRKATQAPSSKLSIPPSLRAAVSMGALPDPLQRSLARSSEREGEAQTALPSEGATQAPLKEESHLVVSGALGDFFKNVKNPAVTFVLNSFYYSSGVNERTIKNRGITGFSSVGPDQSKGFNVDEGSIALFAPVDKYFDLFGVISFKEEGSSIEEAYFYTKTLPASLRLKAGKFKSNVSVRNETHPHEWDFADAPLAYQAFMGRDGIMEKGAQLTYRPHIALSPFIGVEALQGQNNIIFNQNSSGGPHAFTAYAKASYDFDKATNIYFGPYVVLGATETDSVAQGTLFRGESTLYGFETLFSWTPSKERSLTLQGEYLWRTQSGTLTNTVTNVLDPLSRSQDGMYVQALYQMDKWRLGVRYDRLNLLTSNYEVGGAQQNFPNPYRVTGALEFNPSEYSRFRLQYNYDRSGGGSLAYGGGSETNHEVYLQMVLAIGAHMEPKGQRD